MRSKPLQLSFFWHMHQPDYRGKDGIMKMPWVFLHAIKDYYEMPWHLSLYPTLKATFNLSASLIEQLKLYREPTRYDLFLKLWIQHPSTLKPEDKEWLLKLIGAMQFETMIRPLKRYGELYNRSDLDEDELIDLEVVFLLAWCGNYLRTNNPIIQKLLIQEKGYSQQDKELMLETLGAFVAEILPFYGELQRSGKISLSTTPYFHPIVPLLIDIENARIAKPSSLIPEGAFSLEEDAHEHIRRAIELYTETFGCRPKGFWPSEGAVDGKSIELYHQEGIEWIATDEAIVMESLASDEAQIKYDIYDYHGVSIGFRDHRLSDLIGFEYRHRTAEESSEHFMEQLKTIAEGESNRVVFVIVDGENAWEFYHNNGWDFFEALYQELSDAPWCQTITMDEAKSLKKQKKLSRIHPGTWIHGTFDTWVGHSEKKRAWELLFQTRREAQMKMDAVDEKLKEEVKYHLLASECSDWFWWYGEDHTSDFASEFDELFRGHLISVYQLLELPVPEDLWEPISQTSSDTKCWEKPTSMISPRIGGSSRRYFDWIGCGKIDESRCLSTMDRVRGPINIIYYGFDEKALYFRLQGDVEGLKSFRIEARIEEMMEPIEMMSVSSPMGIEALLMREHIADRSMIRIRLILRTEEKEIQTLPGFGYLSIDLNDRFSENWFI